MALLRNNLETLIREKLEIGQHGRLPSQDQLAEMIGVSQTTISRWLNEKVDRVDADTLAKFCGFLDCSIGDLLYLELDS